MDSDLNLGDLGPDWNGTERALADLQADLSRTVEGAPTLILLWRDADEDNWPISDRQGARWAYVGKAADWYYGADGGFELPSNYAAAITAIADELSAAVVDSLLGYRDYWPKCPSDGHLLAARSGANDQIWWVCRHDDRVVAQVGHLPGPPIS